jgi:hypothetical protein
VTRDLVLVAWSLAALLAVIAEGLALARPRRFAHLDEVLGLLTTTTAGRIVFLLGWMWLGWHYFAR